jgi:iron complex outermembrane recepter protein
MKNYVTFVAMLLGGISVPALAQSTVAAAADNGTQDIVVTALKGYATAQQAPTTVVIVSGNEIQSSGVFAIEKLQTVVPGVRFQQSPGGLINPVVRGLGTSSTVQSFEQSIGLFIDGIFAGHSREYSNALFDVSRVELLKGTQAAVVGKSTSLGALSVVLNKPEMGRFDYTISGGHEFALGGNNLSGMINIPVSETFAIRVAGIYDTEGGWIKNVFGLPPSLSTEREGGRLSARWEPNDKLDWTVSGQYTEYHQQGQLFHIGIDKVGQFAAIAKSLGDPNFVIRQDENRYSARPGFSYDGFTVPGSHTEGTKLTSLLNYDLGSATITATTGYGHYNDAYMFDSYGLFESPANNIGTERDENFSQELRIGSNGDAKFSYLLGAYYYNDHWGTNSHIDYIDTPATRALIPPGVEDLHYDQRVETISGFGQLGYKFTDAFNLQGSLRYEHVDKTGTYSRTANALALGPGGIANAVTGTYPIINGTLQDSDGFLTGGAQAQYFLNPRTQFYASFGTGVKAFGFMNLPRTLATAPFETEKSKTFEAGTKIGFGNGSHLNLAAFYTLVDNYQLGINGGPVVGFFVVNLDYKVPGAEAELVWRITPELTFNGSVTYADATKRGVVPPTDVTGAAFSPKWSGIAKMDYSTPISDRYQFNLGGDIEFRSSEIFHNSQFLSYTLFGEQPGYAKFGANIGVEDRDHGVSVSLIADNLFNKFNYTSMFVASGTAAAVAEDRPRTVMLQLTVKH